MKLRILITILAVGSINSFGAFNHANIAHANIASVRKLKILGIEKLTLLTQIIEFDYSQLKKLMQEEEEFRRKILSYEEDADRIILTCVEGVRRFEKLPSLASALAAQSNATLATK